MKRPQHHGATPDRKQTQRPIRRAPSNPHARVHRAEEREARRFTEGPRRQRRFRLAVTMSVLGFLGMVSGIVLSPLMTLDEVVVAGLESVPEEVVVGAVKEQLGTPLALLDYGAIEKRLGGVVQIQSFATELRPPHTLVIRIVERVPIGAIASDSGWDVVDAAGVILSSSAAAPRTVPRLNIEGVDSPGFFAAVRALLALPPSLRGEVATISAETRDTVRLILRGVPHEIRWGSDELSTLKAAVLERALEIASEKGGTFVIDVSAPDTLIMNRMN